jgi:hypothetical protein
MASTRISRRHGRYRSLLVEAQKENLADYLIYKARIFRVYELEKEVGNDLKN